MKRSALYLITAAVLALAGIFAGPAVAADNGYGKQKVVYHINYDDPKRQAGALRNIQNHINAVGAENLDLKVVLHGKGLSLLLEPEALTRTKLKAANATPEIQAKIAGLKDQGIQFQICANTLRGKKINYEEDLYDVEKADIVPSGVAEVAKLQAQGYAYIKP
jgi:intracellular sulfur oxidation DsrE/DsrF family protein